MLAKPDSCKGCPLYGDGQGFVPDALVEGATLAWVAQNPGQDEERGRRLESYVGKDRIYTTVPPQPLIGTTGYELRKRYLPVVGVEMDRISRLNVLKCRWEKGGRKVNDLPPAPILKKAVAHCTAAHLRVPPSTKVIVAHGQVALDWSQGQSGHSVTAWRGYLASSPVQVRTTAESVVTLPVYVTLHIAAIFRSPDLKPVMLADCQRLRRYLKGTWPLPMPTATVASADDPTPLEAVVTAAQQGRPIAIDTEFTYHPDHIPGHHPLTLIGFCWKHQDGAYRVVQYDCRIGGMSPHLREALTALTAHTTVWQNAAADLPVIEFNVGILREAWTSIHDLMLIHALLAPDAPHSLEYIASLVGVLPKFSHLLGQDILTKNKGDVVETLVGWEHFWPRLQTFPALVDIYQQQSLPLIHIHTRASETGIPVNKQAVKTAFQREMDKLAAGVAMAQAYAGYPLNLGSVGDRSEHGKGYGELPTFLYQVCGLPIQKHRKTKRASVDVDAIGRLRQYVGPPYDPEEEERRGLTPEEAFRRCLQGANPILEGRVLYAKALQNIAHYILPLIKQDRACPPQTDSSTTST